MECLNVISYSWKINYELWLFNGLLIQCDKVSRIEVNSMSKIILCVCQGWSTINVLVKMRRRKTSAENKWYTNFVNGVWFLHVETSSRFHWLGRRNNLQLLDGTTHTLASVYHSFLSKQSTKIKNQTRMHISPSGSAEITVFYSYNLQRPPQWNLIC